MKVVTGGKHPVDRWIVVNDDETEVIFDPGYADGHSKSLKLCNIFVQNEEKKENE